MHSAQLLPPVVYKTLNTKISAYRADAQELITSGKGGLVATWRPAEDERGGGGRGGGADDWSDDEVG